MSLWRLQNYGQRDWPVPQTCCMLTNSDEERSYLDPKPQNLTLCQSLLKHEYNRARHKDTCLEHLSAWYQQHYMLFLIAGLVVATVELFVLISIILSCIKMASNHKRTKIMCRSIGTTMETNVLGAHNIKRRAPQPQAPPSLIPHQPNENFYVTNAGSEICSANNNRCVEPVKHTNAYSYHMSNSYLV